MQNFIDRLKNSGAENPVHELRILVQAVLKDDKILLLDEVKLTDGQKKLLESYVERRSKNEPIAKIIGYKYFWNDKFITNQYTLDPRPETELIIESALEYFPDKQKKYSILDLGTGTGCLLLTLLKEYPNSTGIGVDISDDALSVANANAIALNIAPSKVSFVKSSWFENVTFQKFDIIVCNPPYIPEDDPAVTKNAKYDPSYALYSGNDGLDDIRIILQNIGRFMNPKSKLFLEIGYGEIDAVKALLEKDKLKFNEVKNDLQKIPRIVVIETFP